MIGHHYWFMCRCEDCARETTLRRRRGDATLVWLQVHAPAGMPPNPPPNHVYSKGCGCRGCLLETAGQTVKWEEAARLCARHGGDGRAACELCVDQVCGADSDDPVSRVVGEMLAAALNRNFRAR